MYETAMRRLRARLIFQIVFLAVSVGNIIFTWGDVALQICAWLIFTSVVCGLMDVRQQIKNKQREQLAEHPDEQLVEQSGELPQPTN
jgi:hypothetical protein